MPVALDPKADITLEGICVVRGGKEIIHNVDVTLRTGRTTVIMGASGCGKSTLLKIAAGITIPDRGRVLVGEKDIHSLPDREVTMLRSHWGFAFQDAALWANKSIVQNLTLPLLYHDYGISPADAEEKAERLVRSIGYRDDMHLRPSQLSTGELKMVSFARALISGPSLLFLDSPFLSVDHGSIEKMKRVIDAFRKSGGTVCANFQDAKYIAGITDDLIIMKDGRVIVAGPFSDIINTKNSDVSEVISELFDQAASYDGSILDILSDSGNDPFSNTPRGV